jgi:CBS domain-containing protein
MLAREIMTSNPQCVTTDDTLEHAARIMRDSDVGLVPVIEGGDGMRLCGVITDRDIAVRHVAEEHGPGHKVREAMSERLVTVNPDTDVEDVMRRMQKAQVRRVPVVEDGNRLVGIIAQADLVLEAGRDDEVERTIEKISEPARARH